MNIASVSVTYNRLELLKEHISFLRNQSKKIDNIIIVNNGSNDGTKEWLEQQNDLTILNQENKGSAGGFYTGMQYAFELGYDLIWVMDDDGIPNVNCLEILSNRLADDSIDLACPLCIPSINSKEISFEILCNLGSQNIRIKDRDDLTKNGLTEIFGWGSLFNGILFKRNVIEKIGVPKKEMFIWGDEIEYLLRIKKEGFNIITISEALHFHPKDRQNRIKSIWGQEILVGELNWKLFCLYRNCGYIFANYHRYYGVRFLLGHFFYFLIYDIKKLKFFLKAFYSGFKSDFSVDVPY